MKLPYIPFFSWRFALVAFFASVLLLTDSNLGSGQAQTPPEVAATPVPDQPKPSYSPVITEGLRKSSTLQSQNRFKESYEILHNLKPSTPIEQEAIGAALTDCLLANGQKILDQLDEYEDSSEAQNCFRKALNLARILKSKRQEISALRGLGEAHLHDSAAPETHYIPLPQAISAFRQALVLSRSSNDKLAEAQLLELLGDSHTEAAYSFDGHGLDRLNESAFKTALSSYQQASLAFERLGQTSNSADVMMKVGLTLTQDGMSQTSSDEGIAFLKSASNQFHRAGDVEGEASALHALWDATGITSYSSKSLEYYKKSLALFQQEHDYESQAQILQDISHLYDSTGNISQALSYADRSLQLFNRLKDKKEFDDGLKSRLLVVNHILNNDGPPIKIWKYGKSHHPVINEIENQRKNKRLFVPGSDVINKLRPLSLPITTSVSMDIYNNNLTTDSINSYDISYICSLYDDDTLNLWLSTDYYYLFDGPDYSSNEYSSSARVYWLRWVLPTEKSRIRQRLKGLEQPLIYAPFARKIWDPKRYPKNDRLITAQWGKYVRRVEFSSPLSASKYFHNAPFSDLFPYIKRAWIEFCVRVDSKGHPIRVPSAFGRVIAVETASRLFLVEELKARGSTDIGAGENPVLIDLGDK